MMTTTERHRELIADFDPPLLGAVQSVDDGDRTVDVRRRGKAETR